MVELESNDVIPVSPFRKIGKEKESIMKQQYDEPFFLTKTEFNEVVHKECPETLQRVKDVFVVQCCFGCRIGDFRRFTFDNISIEEGIPYIHYLPTVDTAPVTFTFFCVPNATTTTSSKVWV